MDAGALVSVCWEWGVRTMGAFEMIMKCGFSRTFWRFHAFRVRFPAISSGKLQFIVFGAHTYGIYETKSATGCVGRCKWKWIRDRDCPLQLNSQRNIYISTSDDSPEDVLATDTDGSMCVTFRCRCRKYQYTVPMTETVVSTETWYLEPLGATWRTNFKANIIYFRTLIGSHSSHSIWISFI